MGSIRIDDRWQLRKAAYGWEVIESVPSMTKPRDGSDPEPTMTDHTYYYSRLGHALTSIIEHDTTAEGGDAGKLADVLRAQTDRIVAAVARLNVEE